MLTHIISVITPHVLFTHHVIKYILIATAEHHPCYVDMYMLHCHYAYFVPPLHWHIYSLSSLALFFTHSTLVLSMFTQQILFTHCVDSYILWHNFIHNCIHSIHYTNIYIIHVHYAYFVCACKMMHIFSIVTLPILVPPLHQHIFSVFTTPILANHHVDMCILYSFLKLHPSCSQYILCWFSLCSHNYSQYILCWFFQCTHSIFSFVFAFPQSIFSVITSDESSVTGWAHQYSHRVTRLASALQNQTRLPWIWSLCCMWPKCFAYPIC